jgi:hypothetical protein
MQRRALGVDAEPPRRRSRRTLLMIHAPHAAYAASGLVWRLRFAWLLSSRLRSIGRNDYAVIDEGMVLRCPDYSFALRWARLECKSYNVPEPYLELPASAQSDDLPFPENRLE